MRQLTDGDIERIWNSYVRVNDTPDYLNRYVPLPMHRQRGSWPWGGKDFPRVICVLEFERLVGEYSLNYDRLLIYNGGGGDPEAGTLPVKKYVLEIDYPGPGTDAHTLDLPEKDFNLILFGQTLEHLYNPILALRRLWHHLAPGGCLFASAPVVNIPHTTPFHHYTGFTPTGLGCMVETAGFEILHIGQWGNLRYLQLVFATRDWPDYATLGGDIHNDFNNPMNAWILARRPL